MRIISLIFIFFFSCSSISDKELLGKWRTFDNEGNYMELWLNKDLALSYLSSADEILLYEYELEGNTINFRLIESNFLKNHEFKIKINSITEDELYTELIGLTIKPEQLIYSRISSETPNIYPELTKNIDLLTEIQSRTRKN